MLVNATFYGIMLFYGGSYFYAYKLEGGDKGLANAAAVEF